MDEKKQLKIKFSTAIIISLIFIIIICAIVYFAIFWRRDREVISAQLLAENDSIYYEPTEEEIAKAKELANLLRDNLPKMDGSTSTIPLEGGILASLFDISQEDAESGIVHSTTYGSFDNLMEDKCDIIFSTPLSQAQYDTAKSKNIELEVVPIVYEGFVFVVNASNPVDTLTQQQLKDIYSGKITNWKEVGGNDAEIVAYQRNETSGSQNYMTAFMGDTQLMDPVTDFIPASMVGLMDAIATYDNADNAIGYSVYAYAADMYGNGNEIKFIKVDGVEPTKATMASKEYPLLNYNYAIYNKAKTDSTTVDELTEWILTYDGQVAMSNAGYIPIKNIKIEEATITPYTKKGTGEAKPSDYTLDEIKYIVYPDYILQNDKIIGLKDEDLQNKINEFIDDSTSELSSKKQQLDNYLDLLNSQNSEYEFYGYDFKEDEESPIVTEVECINGYLSVQVYLKYMYNVQDGTPYIYDGYSAIFDLYTGKRLELSDLYFKDTDFISNINQNIKYYENHTPELKPERTFKRTFVAIPDDINMYSLTSIGFTKFNPYFAEGEIFYLDGYYQDGINKIIYKARDMKDIWDSSIEVSKEQNSFSFAGERLEKKQDNITYSIYNIDTNNDTVDSKINSYVQNYLETEATPEKVSRYMAENFDSEIDEFIVDAYGVTHGNKVAEIDIMINMENYDELFFNLETGELLDITSEEWMKQIGLE